MAEQVSLDKLVKPLLFWLDVVGCNPRNQSNYAMLRWLLMTLYTLVFMGLIIGHTITTLRNGISFQSVEDVLNFSLFIQFIVKYCFYRVNTRVLCDLMDVMCCEFWPANNIPEHREKFNRMYNLIYFIMDKYRKGYIVMNALYGVEPLFYRKKLLRIPIWLPNPDIVNYSPYYELLFVYELTITMSADFVMLNFELMSLLLLSTAYVQIEMIKTKLSMMGDREFTYTTLRDCVEHHNLILGHLKRIVSTLSTTMLQQVATYFMAICLPAYLFTSTGTVNIGFCVCTIINILNFYLYCLIGQSLYDQCLSVSDAIWKSNWWNTDDLSLRRSMILIMNRSSRGIKLTAGGLFDFTLVNFMQAMKVLFSTLQFLWSTNERN